MVSEHVVQLVCVCTALLSVFASCCMLCHLRRAPTDVRRRLFWRQLVMLACFDLLQGVSKMQAAGWTHKKWWIVSTFLDLSSFFSELLIAAGFAAAAAGWNAVTTKLRIGVMLPCCVLLNLCIVLAIDLSIGAFHFSLEMGEEPAYGYTCLVYAALTIAMYSCGIASTMDGPSQIRRYATVRAVSYLASFTLMGLPLAVAAVLRSDENGGAILDIGVIIWVNWLFNLNGAANAITHAFWVTRPRSRVQTMGDIESSMIRNFFDLDVLESEDDDVFLSRQALESAVAHASGLRRDKSEPEIGALAVP